MACPITVTKFVGTVSLGILTVSLKIGPFEIFTRIYLRLCLDHNIESRD
jgi:hypothetical protein